jgi:hypothetical protein
MPLPTTFDNDELASLLGLDDRSVRRLTKQGVLKRSEKGYPRSAIQQYIKHRESIAATAAGGGAYGSARTRYIEEKAAEAKQRRLEREGKFILLDEMIETDSKIAVVLRTQFMRLPVESAPHLVGLRTPADAQRVLEPRVRELLEELQQMEIHPVKTI